MRTYNTKQAVLNGVWKHFVIDKNPKSVGPHPTLASEFMCFYGGTGCAIGCLIDDKELCKKMDKLCFTIKAIWPDPPINPELSQIFKLNDPTVREQDQLDLEFLRTLQTVHDFTREKLKDPDPNTYTDNIKKELLHVIELNSLKHPEAA